jgi:hypothetical protein
MKTKVVAIAVMGLGALVAPASAQIIATSIPRAESATPGKAAAGQKKFAFHILAAPLSKWKYGEVFIGPATGPDFLYNGIVDSNPNSKVLLAGEVAFALGDKWSLGLGGWWNKIGSTTYHFAGKSTLLFLKGNPVVNATFDTPGDTKIYEGHLNLFYKDVGIQAGIIRTNGKIGGTLSNLVFTGPGGTFPVPGIQAGDFGQATLTDKDAFVVYRRSGGTHTPWGVSIGAGAYRKQGNLDSQLRLGEDHTVFTAFGTVTVGIYKGFGIDASYWYIGKTKSFDVGGAVSAESPIQSRFTLGLGYSFSH